MSELPYGGYEGVGKSRKTRPERQRRRPSLDQSRLPLVIHEKPTAEQPKPNEEVETRTRCEKTLDWVSAGIAYTVSFDACLLKIVDNTLKDCASIFSKVARVGFMLVKWNLIPGSFVIDLAKMLIKEVCPPRKVEAINPFETERERDLRAKNREAFKDFCQAESLSLINRLA